MFDPIAIGFEKLTAYKKAKTFHKVVQIFLKSRPQIDREVSNQSRETGKGQAAYCATVSN